MDSSKEKVELIQLAIKQLMEDEKINRSPPSSSSLDESGFVAVPDADDAHEHDDGENHRLLSRLLAQVDSIEKEGKIQQPGPEATGKPESETAGGVETEREEIVKEIRKLKRQNLITHCLLSVMIALTVVWQVSEVSLIMKVKDGVNHPFRALGSMLNGIIKRPKLDGGGDEGEKQMIQAASIPGLKVPDFPHIELPAFDLVTDEE